MSYDTYWCSIYDASHVARDSKAQQRQHATVDYFPLEETSKRSNSCAFIVQTQAVFPGLAFESPVNKHASAARKLKDSHAHGSIRPPASSNYRGI